MDSTMYRTVDNEHTFLGTDGKIYYDPTESEYGTLGFWRERLNYLMRHDKELYQAMLEAGALVQHLNEVSDQASRSEGELVHQMAVNEGTLELQRTDWLRWVGLLTNYTACAREIVRENIVRA